MMIGKVSMAAILIAWSSAAFAQGTRPPDSSQSNSNQMGSSEQQAACRPDVRRFCRAVSADSGPFVFLACLKEHRERLSRACLNVLEDNGQ
jgi:hypothetical protein